MRLKFIFLFLFTIASLSCGPALRAKKISNISPSHLKSIAFSKRWLNLLYYESNGDQYQSVVPATTFFMNPSQGPSDPYKELVTTIKVFTSPSKRGIHAQCMYPGRYKFLKEHFQLDPPVTCPKYEAWVKAYAPKKLSLVYASQYISNPASVFGHSFLLLPSPTQIKSFWLTYNYAASIPSDTSGVGYVYGGITGWFQGEYSVMPFYHRIFQYGSVENRDLWLYHIRLTSDEFDFMLRHLWELVHTAKFTYYFLSENCAGILLRTFAAVLPDMQEANQLPFYVHPIEVIKAVDRAGRIEKVSLIPSLANTLRSNVKQLNSMQNQQFLKIINNPEEPTGTLDAATSETLIQYTAFLTRKYKGELPQKFRNMEKSALIQRSKFQRPPIPINNETKLKKAPHLSHNSSSLQSGISTVNGTNTLDFTYRFALHDLLDRNAGFLENSTIDFMKLSISANEDKWWLKELTLARIENFQSLLPYDPQASWRINLAVQENLIASHIDEYFLQLQGSYGASFELPHQLYYALLTADLNAGHELPQGHYEIGPEFGLILSFDLLKFFASMQVGKNLFEGDEQSYLKAKSGLRWSIHNNLSLLQENQWYRLPDQNLEGYRLSLSLRYHY